ncbi:rhomboid family intramembrane serine protease [Halopenitus sp. H-Gu1]|uniref:rhomboid family intramembrane serine protease n=1 Tax=Halopenitus sp. H-Gu1 TaxID=3242697 RepID=UPI00359E1220
MAECDECGAYENMPYQCHRCGNTFCSDHRLPESHNCPGLADWNDPSGVFDSGFDDSVRNRGRSDTGVFDRAKAYVGRQTSTGGVVSFFRGNATYLFLALMWVTFGFQFFIFSFFLGIPLTSSLWRSVFVLSTGHPLYVWTWITSVFAHGGFTHIAFNSIALYFFGPVVERRLGTKRFTALFLGAGALAGLAQVGATLLISPGIQTGVVGASGAIMAVMGLLTVLRPNLTVYLYFIIPMPLWLLTIGFAAFSAVAGLSSIGPGGIANWAHLAGLGLGLAYGAVVKRTRSVPESIRVGGGPGGPGRRRF